MSEPKHYTTAIIAAVPAQDDPVHEIVAEDAHVTLQFLGEAADLSEDQIEEIKDSLEMLASVVYPFEATISGTAELGDDKAQVLIVQSALLTKVREMLVLNEAVSTAVASVEQFPNWIPHLTMAYDGEMPDTSQYESVTVGSLELWLADEHISFPLAQAKEAVTAAGVKTFDDGLHPRGADGRFIEKFGIIKFLTGQGWAYGKVEGIYAENGQVKLTVTPSDLSGKTSGDSIVLSPKQVYRAPKTKAHLLVNSLGVTKIGGQGGSNPGGLYSIPTPKALDDPSLPEPSTDQFYVKTPKTKSHGQNEALANLLYEEAGVPVPEVDLASDGKLYSKIVKGEQNMAAKLKDPEWADQVRRNFAVDAWLGNRDVFGMTYDNILTDENGTPWRIDNGGALLYRAMGEKKTDFGSTVTELDAFRQGKKAQIYGPGMTKAQEIDGAERVLAISPGQIDDLVKAHSLPQSLADTLKARRLYIASYYNLTLPESKAPPEAEGPTTAPLVDAPDIAENEGKTRNWFKVSGAQLGFMAGTGDVVELPNGDTKLIGVGDDGEPLSLVGAQSQLLDLMQYGPPDLSFYLKKKVNPEQARPEHGSMLKGSDLSSQRWKRGDQVIDSDGVPLKVLGWNENTGAVLVQAWDKPPVLLDTFGKDKGETFTVQRWDPPAVDTPEPVQTEAQASDLVTDLLAKHAAQPPVIQTLHEVTDSLIQGTDAQLKEAGMPTGWSPPASQDTSVADQFFADTPTPSSTGPSVIDDFFAANLTPAPGKVGQAAEAETAIKADLDQPLPTGNGTPAPKKTSAPGGAKVMIVGDGTEAATGDSVTSKKDGKTYVFVKPKGNYAVVTDPNGEDPDKQLLKLASTMTQPGKLPAGDLDVELPKTATGEVPALGMTAVAKDGWAGEITLISPDGKFVFITNANGVRKRKSVGTVSITGGAQPVAEKPTAPPVVGPLKSYGPAPALTDAKASLGTLDLDDPADLDGADMVAVGYADGTFGLEPYTGQPTDSLVKNTAGKVATQNTIGVYQGPVSAQQFVAAVQASQAEPRHYYVFWDSKVFITDGGTGTNGGLVIWDAENPSTYALELPTTGHALVIADSVKQSESGMTLPDFSTIGSAQVLDSGWTPPLPLYGDEAKSLAEWQGAIVKGSEISLDGENWLDVKQAGTGGVMVEDSNGVTTFLSKDASKAKFVIKAPPMTDGDAPNPKLQGGSTDPDLDALPVSTGKKKIADLVKGDVVTDLNGDTMIIDSVTDDAGSFVQVKVMGEDFGSPAQGDVDLSHQGNLTEEPVSVPIGQVVGQLYPGSTVELSPGQTVTVASYPTLKSNGDWHFAAIPEGEPDSPMLVKVGNGGDVAFAVPLKVQMGSYTSAQELGVENAKLNALFNESTVQSQSSVDHTAEMTDQGIPFGTAGYPIYYNHTAGTYVRGGQNGMEEWDPESASWNGIFGTELNYAKVWDGAPFTGTLKAPDGYPSTVMGMPNADLAKVMAEYKPQPGETVQLVQVEMVGKKTVVISYPFGLNGPAHTVLQHADGTYYTSAEPFAGDWKESGAFTDFATVHDPFTTSQPDAPSLSHQEGPQPPPELGAKFQAAGYTPEPGDQFFVITHPSWSPKVYKKAGDGSYFSLKANGSFGSYKFTIEELRDGFSGAHDQENWGTYTWTYLPAGADAPATVSGLPEGYAPFVPGEGQSLIKVTLGNGKENVYLQKQPEAGWYELGPDGVVKETSDAVKSNFVVQQKLAGKGLGTGKVKYELLHPAPEGVKQAGAPAPEFSNGQGKWTPSATQKVVALTSFQGDADPWFFVQEEPGGDWKPSPNTPDSAGVESDASVKQFIEKSTGGAGSQWTLVWDGPGGGQAAVDTDAKALPSFTGYTPKEGEAVFQEPNGSHWVYTPGDLTYHPVNDDGTLDLGYGLSQDQWKSSGQTDSVPQVWPVLTDDGADTTSDAAPVFSGYTPVEGDTVIKWTPASGNPVWLVKQSDDPTFHPISTEGQVVQSGGISQSQLDSMGPGQAVETVWPATGAGAPATGGVFKGYQTEPGDSVVTLGYPSGNTITLVKKDGEGTWYKIQDDGTTSENDSENYGQDTVEWAAGENTYEITELQGTWKAQPVAEPETLPTSGEAYAGVSSTTTLATSGWTLGGVPINDYASSKINDLILEPGESAYYVDASQYVYVRNSQGEWFYVYPGNDKGMGSPTFASDEEMEQNVAGSGGALHKVTFTAPQAAPVAASPTTYSGPVISGWSDKGLPDPASMGFLGGPEGAAGMQSGMWLFTQSESSLAETAGHGLYVKLAEDVDPGSSMVKISSYVAVKDGVVGEVKFPSTGKPIAFNVGQVTHIYGQNATGTPVPSTATPANAPSVPVGAPSAPAAAPAYPGAQKPSQEDINAWGGSLTKDGHIPTAGMYVTGKGPMSGKVISVSKDKTKAVVLTSDGKKTTRLIEALKTDPSANYSAYAAPVTLKDIPGGMPLAVDTVAEALSKTAKDGKFRAILNGHPGVSGGQMVVTKTTAPSGKVFNRVHLTLTPDQRQQLLATLAGTGEKGDWVKSSKQSEAVTIGDQLPMRKSSTDNPDGTPRWKVDPDQKPPTHTVTKVENLGDSAAGGSQILKVTLKNNTTGEEIVSRFHTGKSVSIYTWDPNKPKPVVSNSFSVSEFAKAQGWQHVTDGGISAVKGGADKGTLYNEPGTTVTKSALGQVSHNWKTLRNVSADGVVIEIADPKGNNTASTTGVTVISVPEGADEKALGAALAKMGIDYRPMNQDDAKTAVRGTLRTLLSLDTSDVDTPKHYTDEMLFAQAGKTMGISDLGWQDVLVGVDESTGKTSFFWSDRARNALAAKASYNLVYRAATTGSAAQIVSTVKYGSASSILKKTTGMLDGSGSVGNGASASSDNGNHAGHGSYASASSVSKLPSSNSFAGYKHAGMMIYHRPEAVLGRIMDYRVANNDAFGMGQGQGSDHMKYATSMSSVRDYFLGGGLPTEAVGFIAVSDASERTKAIEQLKADGFATINGRPVEDIVITKQKAATMKPSDLPPVTIPANARPILDLPVTYDAPAPAAGATTGGEAAA